jgi:hypothetical protein
MLAGASAVLPWFGFQADNERIKNPFHERIFAF